MPITEETPDTDDPEAYRVCHFDKTPKMSTYLVAFIVGEFEAVEATTEDGILVRVWTPMVTYYILANFRAQSFTSLKT